jgi:hypothetical protein
VRRSQLTRRTEFECGMGCHTETSRYLRI